MSVYGPDAMRAMGDANSEVFTRKHRVVCQLGGTEITPFSSMRCAVRSLYGGA
jgi:hypothetical protein